MGDVIAFIARSFRGDRVLCYLRSDHIGDKENDGKEKLIRVGGRKI